MHAVSLASQTLVVYNSADPDSAQLAHYYAARRDIPDDHVVGLRCPLTEEITREQYDESIAKPLREMFTLESWWTFSEPDTKAGKNSEASILENKIRFIALIRGMPLKIAPQQSAYPGDKVDANTPYGSRNEASVDSELMNLAQNSRQISGPLNNPYYGEYGRIENLALPQVMLVCRLDGPGVDDVKQIIDDCIRVERTGLWGWGVIDQRGTTLPGYKMGDDWLGQASETLRGKGFPVLADHIEAILPSGLPLPRTAFYFGWYAGDCGGAFSNDGFHFAPGAVACHIHSFSAATLRSRTTGWCGPLVSHGAAAVLGNVYEPYLALTADPGILTDRLLRGFTFAESAWAAERVTSWMSVNVGDPLYRPYAVFEDGVHGDGSVYQEFADSTERRVVDSSTGFLAEAWAQRKLAEGNEDAAEVLFKEALDQYKEPDNLARVTWWYGQMMIADGKKWRAVDLVKNMQKSVRTGSSSGFLLTWLTELLPPTPTPAIRPANSAGTR